MTLKFHKKDCFLGVTNSLLKKSWIKRVFNKRLSLQISQKYSYSQLISTLLASRNLNINNIEFHNYEGIHAITIISTKSSSLLSITSTVALAGLLLVKYSP